MDEELFQFTKAETDINADFNSYFFIYKYLAGSGTTDYLSVEKDTGMALNETHGAKPAGRGKFGYAVKSIFSEGKVEPLSQFNNLFLSIWLDANKDQYIDQQELIWVKVNLK